MRRRLGSYTRWCAGWRGCLIWSMTTMITDCPLSFSLMRLAALCWWYRQFLLSSWKDLVPHLCSACCWYFTKILHKQFACQQTRNKVFIHLRLRRLQSFANPSWRIRCCTLCPFPAWRSCSERWKLKFWTATAFRCHPRRPTLHFLFPGRWYAKYAKCVARLTWKIPGPIFHSSAHCIHKFFLLSTRVFSWTRRQTRTIFRQSLRSRCT